MRICFWATTFQADIQALACHLAAQDGIDVMVALGDPARYRAQAVEKILPFQGQLVDKRKALGTWFRRVGFGADILIVDNHLPKPPIDRLYVCWHGYGWRMDHPTRMRRNMARRVGDVTQPNPRFRWQAFGKFDRDFTAGHRKIHPENIETLGSAYSDLVRPQSPLRAKFDPAIVQEAYPGIDVVNRPTVMIGMTWHHGGLLGHWGEEWDLLGQLLDHILKREANVILRMHDRHRYDQAYLEQMHEFCRKRPGVLLKFKSESPDSLIDLLVSDMMITNYSSFANAFYYTERPCVHIVPPEAGEGLVMREWSVRGLSDASVDKREDFWKHPPEDVGGLRAKTFEELLESVDRTLDEPNCCVELARDFIGRHIESVDGNTCARIQESLASWIR